MSVRISSSFQKSPLTLSAEEKPLRAVKILPAAAAGAARRRFHLGLLLDTSGSMDGARIAAVKTTLGLLLSDLSDDDSITIITYESAASFLARGTVIDAASRADLRTRIDALHADGGTNLEAALLLLREVGQDAALPALDAAFVLTDGHINQGLTSSSGLIRILNAAVPTGTPVYTLGFGADHNSRMLRDIALRTRGSYTYADAAELIPATIADIISGLATEVGRQARLIIPDGWRCLELTAEAGSTEFVIGALIADKEQMVVLEGPAGPCADVPVLTFTWVSPDGTTHTETCASYNDFESLVVEEQFCRCRVATVQTAVQELLETHKIAEARAALTALGEELDRNPAKDRSFVISLRAQIDEMVDALVVSPTLPPVGRPGNLARAFGMVWSPVPSMPSLAPVMSRMASNTAALGIQRGVLSHVSSVDPRAPSSGGGGGAALPSAAPPLRATASGITHTFSSPAQRRATHTMTERYSQVASAAPHEEDEDIDTDTIDAIAARIVSLSAPPSAAPLTPPRRMNAVSPTHPPTPPAES